MRISGVAVVTAIALTFVPSGFGADTVAWGSSVNGLRLGIAFGADPSKPTLRILLQNVGSAVQDVLIGYETGRGLSYVMKFIATAPDENKREGFHRGVFTGCGFHTGQIPRDLLQQAVDILPVRGRRHGKDGD